MFFERILVELDGFSLSSRRFAEVQKIECFFNETTFLLKFHQFYSAEKIPRGIRIRLENHIFPNWKRFPVGEDVIFESYAYSSRYFLAL